MLVYSEREFKGKMLTLGPNQEVSNLDELKFENEVDSIQLVNSLRIFEEFRSEPANKTRDTQEQRKKAGTAQSSARRRSKEPVIRADTLSAR